MTQSLILILTPYEMKMFNHVLELAMKSESMDKNSQSYRALVRMKDKVEHMLSEYAKDHP